MSEQPDRWDAMTWKLWPTILSEAERITFSAALRAAHAAGHREGIEEAAQVCDLGAKEGIERRYDSDWAAGCGYSAARIRALIPASETKEAT